MIETIGWISVVAIVGALLFCGFRYIYVNCERDLTCASLVSIIILVLFILISAILFVVGQGIYDVVSSHKTEKVVTMYSMDGSPACSWDTTATVIDGDNSVKFTTTDGIEITIKDAPVVIKEKDREK